MSLWTLGSWITSSKTYTKVQSIFKTVISEIYLISYIVNHIFKTSSKPYTKVQSIFKTVMFEIYLISYIVNLISKTSSKPYTMFQSILKTGISELYLISYIVIQVFDELQTPAREGTTAVDCKKYIFSDWQ